LEHKSDTELDWFTSSRESNRIVVWGARL
jgi:hypothetical protein